jgi:hypothetical protein
MCMWHASQSVRVRPPHDQAKVCVLRDTIDFIGSGGSDVPRGFIRVRAALRVGEPRRTVPFRCDEHRVATTVDLLHQSPDLVIEEHHMAHHCDGTVLLSVAHSLLHCSSIGERRRQWLLDQNAHPLLEYLGCDCHLYTQIGKSADITFSFLPQPY